MSKKEGGKHIITKIGETITWIGEDMASGGIKVIIKENKPAPDKKKEK